VTCLVHRLSNHVELRFKGQVRALVYYDGYDRYSQQCHTIEGHDSFSDSARLNLYLLNLEFKKFLHCRLNSLLYRCIYVIHFTFRSDGTNDLLIALRRKYCNKTDWGLVECAQMPIELRA
jgi:hypothetical protein